MAKSADAFRTISEVADWLGIQAHVLRFWESKFSQVKPIKRAGGRRYYRPNDMLLLGGIRQLLHEDGLTIKGVQKILREEGVAHVATMSQPLDELTQTQFDDSGGEMVPEAPMLDVEQNTDESAVVLSFDTGATDVVQPEQAASGPPAPVDEEPEGDLFSGLVDTPEVEQEAVSETVAETSTEPDMPPEPEVIPKAEPIAAAQEDAAQGAQPETEPESTPEAVPEPVEAAQEPAPEKAMPAQEPTTPDPEPEAPPETEAAPAAAALPAFLRRPMAEPAQTPAEPSLVEAVPAPSPEPGAPDEEKQDAPAAEAPLEEPVAEAPEVAAEPAPLPKPRIIEMPTITPVDQIKVAPAHLTAAMRTRHLTTDQAKQIAPLLDRLTHLRDAMVAHGTPSAPNSTDS